MDELESLEAMVAAEIGFLDKRDAFAEVIERGEDAFPVNAVLDKDVHYQCYFLTLVSILL